VSGAKITGILGQSPAERAGLAVGDEITTINGVAPTDIIEYQRLIDGPSVEMVIRRPGSELPRKVRIEKIAGEPMGLTVESAVFDRIRTCDNHCSFCFIYQLPKGMRRSLYVKDDDYRLSFLYGNYTTLTRFTEFDLERVLDERLSPLYVSIHATDPDTRADMLRNPRGATSLQWLRALLDGGIEIHGQVVLCPGINDGEILRRTLEDATTTYASMASLSIVPVGVSEFSTESSMRPFTRAEAEDVINSVASIQEWCRSTLGRTMVYASDEFYLIAGHVPPSAEHFESLDQAENGIGLTATFLESFRTYEAMPQLGSGFFQSVDGAPAWGYRAPRATDHGGVSAGPVTILTGVYAAPVLRQLLDDTGFSSVSVVPVENTYFGGNIAVAGLLTGHDLSRVLNDCNADGTYLIPDLCLSEDRFLDGRTIDDLPRRVRVVPTSGVALRRVLDEFIVKESA
jgi:putative radical SAM enzyme (TIGR03279 family)